MLAWRKQSPLSISQPPSRHAGENRIQMSLKLWIPGRATPDSDPGLPGMTMQFWCELRFHDTNSVSIPHRGTMTRGGGAMSSKHLIDFAARLAITLAVIHALGFAATAPPPNRKLSLVFAAFRERTGLLFLCK